MQGLTVGIYGLQKGVGSTYTAMLMAHFMTRHYGNTAFLECNQQEDMDSLRVYLNIPDEGMKFRYHNIVFFQQARKQLVSIFNYKYCCFILDFGSDWQQCSNEFLRCDIKIVVISSAEWKQSAMQFRLDSLREVEGFQNWNYIIGPSLRKDEKAWQKQYGLPLHTIGWEPEMRGVSDETEQLFMKVINNR